MSDSERPDQEAFEELEHLVRALGEELAVWRRRGQLAEARVKELEAALDTGARPHDNRVRDLERENAALRSRLDAAGERTKALLDRMQFLRQQHELGGHG